MDRDTLDKLRKDYYQWLDRARRHEETINRLRRDLADAMMRMTIKSQ